MRTVIIATLILTCAGLCRAQESVIIADEITIPGGGEQVFTFQRPLVPDGKAAVIHFRGRLQHDSYGGHAPGVRVFVNDAELDGSRLVNKPQELQWGAGKIVRWWSRGFRLMYSVDFEGNNREDNPYYVHGGQAYTFDLDITDLLAEGENTLKLAHVQRDPGFRPAIIADLSLRVVDAAEADVEPAGPPTGPLPFIAPESEHAVEYTVMCTPLGGVLLTLGGEQWQVESAFSDEVGRWNTLSTLGPPEGGETWTVQTQPQGEGYVVEARGRDYTLQRTVTPHPEYVEVVDRVTNTSGRDIALLQRHEVVLAEGDDIYLCGLHPPKGTGVISEPSNPTTLVIRRGGQVGIMPADDVLRAHSENYAEAGRAGVRDQHGALAAGATQSYTWQIYPSTTVGYYRLVNAIRRTLGVNFTIPGGVCFLDPREPFLSMSDEELGAWLDSKNAKYVNISIYVPQYHGKCTHGTAFLLVDHTPKREFAERIRRIRPGTQVLVYFHCFISTEDEAPEKYASARILAPDGTGREYPTGRPSEKGLYPMFLPLQDNEYGQKMREYMEMILDECGADGVYWDEMAQSAWQFHYGEPWDGVSADVDPQKLTITRKKSAVTLITQPFRQELVERILNAGVPLIGNGAPMTTTMSQYHFPRFIETGELSNLLRGQLYTPIGLGDHLSEVTGRDCAVNMRRQLDYGSLYYFYHAQVRDAYPSISAQMFPCTPIELGAGYIIAAERILTNISGNFGWGDNSEFEVHVYGPDGLEIADFPAPVVEHEGARWVELRLPRDHAAAIVRR
ncbi:MAG: hypothetical protein ACUVX8_08955 [Candidatus Zipacnadales bacterium]